MIEIFVKARTHKILTFEIDCSAGITDLKRMYLERLEANDPGDIRFLYCGNTLYDTKTLAEYGVHCHSEIHEFPKMRGGAGIIPHDSKRLDDISGYRIKHKKTLVI